MPFIFDTPPPAIIIPENPAIVRPGDADFLPPIEAAILGVVRKKKSGTVYEYYRLYIVDIDGGAEVSFAEWEIMVGTTSYPTSKMTSNTAPPPLVASASDESVAGGYNVLDGVAASSWSSNGSVANEWIKIFFGTGNGIVATGIKITARSSIGNRAPKNMRLEGSAAGLFGGEETVLLTPAAQTGWTAGEVREFTI